MKHSPMASIIYGFVCIPLIFCSGCQSCNTILEPGICYMPQPTQIERLPSAFPPLSAEERDQEWGRELLIGMAFARELDLYRAITSFKRALVLLPCERIKRRLQVEYSIIQCYYLGQKYAAAVEIFEKSELTQSPGNFPAFGDLLIMLYESYQQIGEPEKAECILQMIEKHHPEVTSELRLGTSLRDADLSDLSCIAQTTPSPETGEMVQNFLCFYSANAKSVQQAQTLNALLPGAGFYYVGQRQTALTSFLINTLFIAAAYNFFDHGNVAAGIITTSLELGWYIGGINGAGIAAKEYNQYLYQTAGKEIMVKNRLFPVLMLKSAF